MAPVLTSQLSRRASMPACQPASPAAVAVERCKMLRLILPHAGGLAEWQSGRERQAMRLACSRPAAEDLGTQTPSQCRNRAASGTDKATDTLAMPPVMRESVGVHPARACRGTSGPVLPC